MRRILMILALAFLAAALVFLQFYWIPVSTGDRFAQAVADFDLVTMEDLLCDATTLGAIREDLAGRVTGLLRDRVLFEFDSDYDVMRGDYHFRLHLSDRSGFLSLRLDASPEITLDLKRSFLRACVNGVHSSSG
jgi:hypothetical protein